MYVTLVTAIVLLPPQRSDSTSHDKEQHSASPEGTCIYM